MKRFLLAVGILFALSASAAKKQPLSNYVNTFIGSEGVGHTYPGATTPFGMVQLSPDTRSDDWSACSGYQFADKTIFGFSHTHLSGTGGADLGDVLVLPLSDKVTPTFINTKSTIGINKDSEKAYAGYYTVIMDNGVKAELTATTRCGVHRYTYPASKEKSILFDLTHFLKNEKIEKLEIKQISDYEIIGMRYTNGWTDNQPVYFVARFSEPITNFTIYQDGAAVTSKSVTSKSIKALVEFAQGATPLEMYVGISATGYEGAEKNLDAEVAKMNFDKVHAQACKIWDKELSKLNIEGATEDEKTVFYTALYHSLICPNTFSDVDNKYWGMDHKVHQGTQTHYTTFSLWDTFRAVHPLFCLMEGDRAGMMMQSMLDKCDQFGYLPKWELWCGETDCMIGNHALSVLGEAVVKDIKGFDYEKAYNDCVKTLETNRDQFQLYTKYGYIPSNEVGRKSVSKTVEYAYNDWCLAQIAKKLGKTKDYEFYAKRSLSYRNLFDGQTGFFRGKENNGQFDKRFRASYMDDNFTEATPWQYRHFAPHDVKGLSSLLGGRDSLTSSLDQLFNADTAVLGKHLPDVTGLLGQYAHGNEPSHGTAFLYAYSSEPWRTSAITKKIIASFYLNATKGLCGNDDCGQMSAWYVFASMGLYPMCPGSDQYILTGPVFQKSTITLANGKKFITEVKGDRNAQYINKIWLNGKEINRNYITHGEIMKGGKLLFELTNTPNKERASSDEVMPYSLTTTLQVSTPFSTNDIKLFEQECVVELQCRTANAKMYYTTDGSTPNEKSTLYITPIKTDKTTRINAIAYAPDMNKSDMMSIVAEKVDYLKGLDVNPTVNGVNYRYYEGNIMFVDEITTKGKLVKQGTMPSINIKFNGRATDHFGFIFETYLKVDKKDIFFFNVTSDDGAVLYIDGKPVVLNDGSHSQESASGRIGLDKGFHKIEVRYFDDTYYDVLTIGCMGDGHDAWSLPKNKIFVVE